MNTQHNRPMGILARLIPASCHLPHILPEEIMSPLHIGVLEVSDYTHS